MQADDTERGLCHVPIGPRRQDQRRPNLAECVRGYLWQGIGLQPVITRYKETSCKSAFSVTGWILFFVESYPPCATANIVPSGFFGGHICTDGNDRSARKARSVWQFHPDCNRLIAEKILYGFRWDTTSCENCLSHPGDGEVLYH